MILGSKGCNSKPTNNIKIMIMMMVIIMIMVMINLFPTRAALASEEGQMIFESGTDDHSVEVTGRHCTVKIILIMKRRFVKMIMKKKILMTIMIMKKILMRMMMMLILVLVVDQVQPPGPFRVPLWHRVNHFLHLSSGETSV